MNYLRHRKMYLDYLQAQSMVQQILDEDTMLFQLTQPKSSISDSERVSGGSVIPKTELYIIRKEEAHINERLAEAHMILHERYDLMHLEETDLRKSKDVYDQVYVAKWIDGYKADRMIKALRTRGVYYSRSQIYNIMARIRQQIERL